MINRANFILKVLELVKTFGDEYIPLPNTTLNEKYGVGRPSLVGNGYPFVRYFSIGALSSYVNGGIMDRGAFNPIKVASVRNQIPLAIKPVGSEFDSSNYFIKKHMVINGVRYHAWYVKRISDFSKVQVIEKSGSTGNVINTNDSIILNPETMSSDINLTTIEVTKKVLISLTINDISNLIEVISLLNIKSNIISEIGLCSGIEYDEELHCCQTVAFSMIDQIINNKTEPITFTINIGNFI